MSSNPQASNHVSGQPDRTPRRRSAKGNRKGATFPVVQPLAENVPSRLTPLQRVYSKIAEKSPGLAAWLEYRQDHERLHAQVVSQGVCDREERLQASVNAKTEARNAEIDSRIGALRRRAEAEAEALCAEIAEVRVLHGEAETVAAAKLAAIGRPYDPADISEAALIRPAGATLRSSAAEMGLPAPGGADGLYMPAWAGWYTSAVVGVLVGISLFVVAHIVHPDTAARHPLVMSAGAAIGFGIALLGKWAIRLAWAKVGQYYVVPRPPARWIRAIAVALSATGAVLVSDMALEMKGLLSLASIQARMETIGSQVSASGPTQDQLLLFMAVSFVVTGPYVILASLDGYFRARDAEVASVSAVSANNCERGHEAGLRSDPDVRAAQQALSDVRRLRRRIDLIVERGAHGRSEAEREIADLEAKRLPEDVPLSSRGEMLVQDSIDDARSAGILFTEHLEAALAAAEPIAASVPRRGRRPLNWLRWLGRWRGR